MVKENFTAQLAAIREKIKKGLVNESFPLLEELIAQLSLDKIVVARHTTDLFFLQSEFNALSKLEMQGTASEEHRIESRRLIRGILQLVIELEDEVNSALSTTASSDSSKKHRVELKLDLDFEKTTEPEIKALLKKIAAIIKTNPDELIIINKRHGSVIVEMELPEGTIKKIKSLVKIGVFKELKGFQVVDSSVNSRNETEDLNIYLPDSNLREANLIKTNLSGANLIKANLIKANLIKANLSRAHLSRAYLIGADLRWADLRWADLRRADLRRAYLIGADLRWADLSAADLNEANLHEADLSGADLSAADLSAANLSAANLSAAYLRRADLSGADLSGADLSGADLNEAIFHTDQAEILEAMNVDISEVIFIDDDDGKKIESWVKVE